MLCPHGFLYSYDLAETYNTYLDKCVKSTVNTLQVIAIDVHREEISVRFRHVEKRIYITFYVVALGEYDKLTSV